MRSTEVSSTGTWGTDYEAGTGSSKIFLPGFLEKSPGGSDLPFGIRALVSFEYPDHGGHRGLPHAGAGGGTLSMDLGDSTAILLSSLLLLLLFSDLPG